jgi:isopentenyl-diphosphate delta-isomerase
MAEEGDSGVLLGLDDIQSALMEEQCILIDENDHQIGSASKKVCHLMASINKGMLHRAFSVFLFNSDGQLLIQQRSSAKITYPSHWTNTCCSHPLYVEPELDETDCIGVRRAAQRKLQHELGIESQQVPLDSFHYLTRIHYKSANVPDDKTWGEHEIDYILFIQRDVTLRPNDNEVMDQRFVTRDQLKQLIAASKSDGTLLTPWFKLIVDKFLWTWWDRLDNLAACMDHTTIHRMC